MVSVQGAVPVLPVLDVQVAGERWRRLGFTVTEATPDYAFAERDGVWLHLSRVDEHPENGDVSLYLYVDDADGLHAEWVATGVEGRLHAPADTPYGVREGNYIDPDGVLVRFGSPL